MAGRGQERSLNRIATGEESELNMFLRGPKVWHLVGPLDRPSIPSLPMEVVVLQLQYGSVQDRRTQREGRTRRTPTRAALPGC